VTFVTWLWHQDGYRERFTAAQVNQLCESVGRGMQGQAHRFVCVTDGSTSGLRCETFPLWPDLSGMVNASGPHLPSCYRRLKLWAGETTRAMGVRDGARVVSLDIDMVPIRDLPPLFDRDEDFLGWKVPGAHHPQVFNGSIVMFRAGAHPHVWEEFDPATSPAKSRAAGYFGSDQGWISYCMVGSGERGGWDQTDGVYGYRGIRYTPVLPRNARIVSFCGKHKQWHPKVRSEAPWLAEHWPM
jgi:hypothetical protein